MCRAFKFLRMCQQADKDRLADVLCIVGIFQIGIAEAQNGVRIGLREILCPIGVQCLSSFGGLLPVIRRRKAKTFSAERKNLPDRKLFLSGVVQINVSS